MDAELETGPDPKRLKSARWVIGAVILANIPPFFWVSDLLLYQYRFQKTFLILFYLLEISLCIAWAVLDARIRQQTLRWWLFPLFLQVQIGAVVYFFRSRGRKGGLVWSASFLTLYLGLAMAADFGAMQYRKWAGIPDLHSTLCATLPTDVESNTHNADRLRNQLVLGSNPALTGFILGIATVHIQVSEQPVALCTRTHSVGLILQRQYALFDSTGQPIGNWQSFDYVIALLDSMPWLSATDE